MKKLQSTTGLLMALGTLALAPVASADEWNQKTTFAFSAPVEIPGQTLPAGTYVFKLADSPSNRNIVQIFSEDQKKIFGTFLAIPDYRMEASDKPIIVFKERPAGSPEAIKGWFYPGRNHGHEFVYPKNHAVSLAQANHTPVPSMPEEVVVKSERPSVTILALKRVPLKAEEPNGEEIEIAQAFETSAPVDSTLPSSLPERLPATASSLPLVGLLGMFSLGTAVAVRLVAGRVK
jgi:hypothetical protein